MSRRGLVYAVGVIVFCLYGASSAAPPVRGFTIVEQAEAKAIALQRGWLIRQETPSGQIIELQKIVNGIPMYYATNNIDAARTISTDDVWPGGFGGFSLNGSGVKLGVWDGGRVRTTHQEMVGRVTGRDGFVALVDHSTHVACTMIGAGVFAGGGGEPAGQSKGMSFAATVDSYDFNNDEGEMNAAGAEGLRVSNHSYGLITGWSFGDAGAGVGWYWYGDVTVSQVEDYAFGFYSPQSRDWDDIAYTKPGYLIAKSAGNDRNEGPSPGSFHYVSIGGVWTGSTTVRNLDGNSGYDSLGHATTSKNILSVGAINDIPGGYSGPGSVSMSSFSCWGPCDDGRIKPDVVGNGVSLFSAFAGSNTAYGRFSGTSMSTPNVAGSLGLLIEHHRDLNAGEDMTAATVKGLVIHTADECGANTGPDYTFGWGLVNTKNAVGKISENVSNPGVIQELVLGDGQSVEQTWTYTGSGPIRATIVWTDPPGHPPTPVVDSPDKALVNDLDLRIIGPDSTEYFPWRLNPANPTAAATMGDNISDNVEMVYIASPTELQTAGASDYVVRITHKGTLEDGLQAFSLILTGVNNGPAAFLGACCDGETCSATNTAGDCATAGGEWYGGADCSLFACPAVRACCQGCPPSAVCGDMTKFQCGAISGAWNALSTCAEATCAPVGNDCNTEIQVVTEGIYPFDNRCATNDGPASVSCDNGSQTFGRDLWFSYTASATGTMTASLCGGTNFDAIAAIYTNNTAVCPCPVNSSTQYGACSDDSCGTGGGPPILTRDVTLGVCYTIRVAGWQSAQGTGNLEISLEPQQCFPPNPAQAEPGGPNKNRYLTFSAGDAGVNQAVRVRLDSLYHPPVPGPNDPDFSMFEDDVRWVGPPTDHMDGSNPFKAAELQCDPFFADFGAMGLLHVYGAEVMPASGYSIQVIDETCGDELGTEEFYSDPLPMVTTRKGDVVSTFGTTDFFDINAVIDKFRFPSLGVARVRAQMQPNVPNPNASINFLDITDAVDGFRNQSYPYAGPSDCGP